MLDKTVKIDGTLIHQEKRNSRLVLTQTPESNWESLLPKVKKMAYENKFGKIVGRVPEGAIKTFQLNGYRIEAKIPGLYNGHTTGYFLADYLNKDRMFLDKSQLKKSESIRAMAKAAQGSGENISERLPSNLSIQELNTGDIVQIGKLHRKAFSPSSSPVYEPENLLQLFNQNHLFYGLFRQDELVVTALVKLDEDESNVEILDFATHPSYCGENLSYYLVPEIKRSTSILGYKTIYTLVRASSYGFNITLSKLGFILAGTLLNNTVVGNTLENMNVWYLN
ncbi:putative beta-lysine N-acetyltransferase [Pareuzebyella sediminis]|uniref:hypothetical protein n=1 Tax=Pareuzebyella sediminis TaxID=2607998 RepID=UPI0011EC0392|nr:hypothetical protein [Pareuzebyella sediminis]